jgi:hypothetical protein
MIIGILIGMWLHNNLILFLISICLIIPIFFYKSDYFFHICLGCLIVICGIFISFVRLKGIDQNLKFFNELHGDSISFSSVIHQTKKALNELGDKVNANDKAEAEKKISELEALIKDDNATKEQIETKVNELNAINQKLAQQAASTNQGTASDANSNAKKDDDDVIDAEVE